LLEIIAQKRSVVSSLMQGCWAGVSSASDSEWITPSVLNIKRALIRWLSLAVLTIYGLAREREFTARYRRRF